jgi:hypothetical protein
MNNPLTRAADSIKPASPSRLSKTYKVSLKKIIAILLIVIVAFSAYALVIDRVNTHKNWATLVFEATTFRDHIEHAYVGTSGVSNQGTDELQYAIDTIWIMHNLDNGHLNQLSYIEDFLINAHGLNYINATIDSKTLHTVQSDLRELGPKILMAYTGFINYTSVNSVDGPSLWYFGPAPPDEATLQEAVDLAVNANALIQPILRANY